jgi:hypothetical protein
MVHVMNVFCIEKGEKMRWKRVTEAAAIRADNANRKMFGIVCGSLQDEA